MKIFKKFFTGIHTIIGKIGKSREWEIAKFTFKSITACVDFHDALTDFIDQMKLVVASLAIIGKWALRGILGMSDKTKKAMVAAAK